MGATRLVPQKLTKKQRNPWNQRRSAVHTV